MVGSSKQVLHFLICIEHVILSTRHVCAQCTNTRIIYCNRRVEALCFILRRLDDFDYIAQLSILLT